MGGCLQSKGYHNTIVTETTKNQEQVKRKKEPQSSIISPDTFARFFSSRHVNYLENKYIFICSSKSQSLSSKKMFELFSYLDFSNETMKNLYAEFKKDRKQLDYETFKEECEYFISCSNEDLSKYIYRLYFTQNLGGNILTTKFEREFRSFFKNSKMETSKLKQISKTNPLHTKLKQLPIILDSRKQGTFRTPYKQACKWIIENVDLKRFRLFFLEFGLQVDEKQAYNAFMSDQKNLILNGECMIIEKKWCQSMIKYIKSKYDNTKEIKDVSNVRQSNLEHSIHSSEVSKGSLHKMVSLGGVQSQVFQLPPSSKKQTFVDEYDLSVFPGKINNPPLSGNFEWQIKQNIKQIQYIKVLPKTFEKLWICYGGGPKFLRHLYKGYLDLKPYFIKIYKFQFHKEQNKGSLTSENLEMVSSKEKIKNILPNIVNKFIAFHRNVGENWQQFPFEESEETVEEVFSTTSFLIYMPMNFKKEFQKIYIAKETQKNLPKIGDTYETKEKNKKFIVCVRQVQKKPSKKNRDLQQIYVKYVSLTEVHPLKRVKLEQFHKQFRFTQNSMKTLHKRKNLRAGIQNLGNTCYMNAALQNIIAVRNQIEMFKEDKKISKEILVIIKQIEKRKKSIFPLQFKTAFDESFPYFKGDQQQDAHEFLISLLTQLQEENQPVIKKEFDAKITSYIDCKSCHKVKQNVQSARIISLPLRDYNKKQMKIDLIRKNKNITTFTFEVDPQITVDEWVKMFKKASKLQKFYICQITNSNVSRVFNEQNMSQTIKNLKIESQDYLVAYELQQFQSCKELKLKRSLYTYTDSSNKKRIAKIEKIFSGSKIGKREKEESEALILYKNGDKFYNENVHGTQLLQYPYEDRKILIKIINYDSDYEEIIGVPFVLEMPAHFPLFCIREWLQRTIGRYEYILRIAPFGNPKVCANCDRKYCEKWQCFTDDEEKYPLEWYENRVQFVVRWKNSFKYKQVVKREKFLENSKNLDPSSMDSFKTGFQLFEQPSSFQMTCSFCKKEKTTISSREKVTTWPNTLIFHLKRFRVAEEGLIKIFTKWRLQNEVVFGNIKYELKGIILHVGINIDSGHYTAVIDGYKYDNDVVKECSFEEVPPEQIYMLFYVRVQ